MKGLKFKILLAIPTLLVAMACEDQINPSLEDSTAQIVIDAWINNKPVEQVIYLSQSRPYFDRDTPNALTGAQVSVTESSGTVYNFTGKGEGAYGWSPDADEVFGKVGNSYTLEINHNGKTYISASLMSRVPEVDSITFRFEKKDFIFPDSYWAEFWSRDFEGAGDTYWIKSFKNGQYLNRPIEINIAFDAGFSKGGNIDGLNFIPPIRDAINPLDEKSSSDFLSPFRDGDSVYVEIHSIPYEAFIFLNEMALQIDRPGGFGELFATPLANVPTNISSSDPNEEVLGFFTVSAVSGNGKKLIAAEVSKED